MDTPFTAGNRPIVTGQSVNIEEDGCRVIHWADFGVGSTPDSTELVVRFDSAPTQGTLFLDQRPVQMGEVDGEWIDVAGTRLDGVWNQVDIIIDPVNDSLSEGVEVFDAFLAAEVVLPTVLSNVTGERKLTQYLRLAETQARILDDPQSTDEE